MSKNNSIIFKGLTFLLCGAVSFGAVKMCKGGSDSATGNTGSDTAQVDTIHNDTIDPVGPEPAPEPGKGYSVTVQGLSAKDRAYGGLIFEGHSYPDGTVIESDKKINKKAVAPVEVPGYKATLSTNFKGFVVTYKADNSKVDPNIDPNEKPTAGPSPDEISAIINGGGKNYDKLRGASLNFSNFDGSQDGERPTSIALIREKFQYGTWRSVTVTNVACDKKGKVTSITMTINR